MSNDVFVLCLTAAFIGFFHTVIGPDHYLPFMDKLCSLLVTGREDLHPVTFTQGCAVCLEHVAAKDAFSVTWFLIPHIV